ncbi:hypothetical protein [Longirhabdus pacifica]|uniref:hypothetical protein n=1 Tax=Longirhabdus pacifica TaxID=2305227 RepID=UPI001008A0AA|nr:hypothetical protein [Longirhabdus pacifica]
MNAVIVNCFDTYEDRVDLIYQFLKKQGHDVIVIQSDFRHFKKVKRENPKEGFTFVESKPYYKNLSVQRLSSHYKFARDAFKVVEEIKPDLLYTFVPPNSLAKFSAKYKQKNPKMKLIFDLMDLWPETMPTGNLKKLPPFIFWGALRDRSIRYSDFVITECDLYQSVLKKPLKELKIETLYLTKKGINVVSKPKFCEDEIHLSYLGSINNIIDIQKIQEIIQAIKKVKPVTLHIIGDGESKQDLIDVSKSAGATVIYYGKVYDSQVKQNIFDKCHFGLNIMKATVCVGLTMKSIDYFQHRVPILNNISADTAKLVDGYDIGYNIHEDLKGSVDKILCLNSKDHIKMRINTQNVFDQFFSMEAGIKKLDSIFREIGI